MAFPPSQVDLNGTALHLKVRQLVSTISAKQTTTFHLKHNYNQFKFPFLYFQDTTILLTAGYHPTSRTRLKKILLNCWINYSLCITSCTLTSDQNYKKNIKIIHSLPQVTFLLICQVWLLRKYCQTCIKRSPLGQGKSGLIRQVTS